MSQSIISKVIAIDGVRVDPTTVKLSNKAGTYGVRRTDNQAVVVADDTDMDKLSVGVYAFTFTDPAPGLTYEYVVEFVYVDETYHISGTRAGGTDTSENVYNLIPEVETVLRGHVPTNFIKQQLRHIAGDFCRKTGIWQHTLASIPTVLDQKVYTLTPTFDAHIRRVLSAKIGDAPQGFKEVSEDGTQLTLSAASSIADEDLDVKVVLIPDETATQLEIFIIQRWGQAIVDGAEWRLKGMPDKPWFDPNGSVLAKRKYDEQVGDAKLEVITRRGPVARLGATKRRFV